jgi:hypothetical protein
MQYTISKFNNVIEISLSHETIQIKKTGVYICFYSAWAWNGKQFIVSDGSFDKMSVLHPCVKKNEYKMYQHLTSAFQHIIPSITPDDLLCVFAALLSLKTQPSLSNTFKKICYNKIIWLQYKILKYKKRKQYLLQNTSPAHVMIPIYEYKIKLLVDKCIQLSKQLV